MVQVVNARMTSADIEEQDKHNLKALEREKRLTAFIQSPGYLEFISEGFQKEHMQHVLKESISLRNTADERAELHNQAKAGVVLAAYFDLIVLRGEQAGKKLANNSIELERRRNEGDN